METNTEPQDDRTIGQLVADVSHDMSTIMRNEIALAKAELTKGAKSVGVGAGLFAGAAFVGLLGVIFLFHTLAMVIAIWLPEWAGYLIVTGLLFVVAGILALVGKNAIAKAQTKPERTIRNAQETVEVVKGHR